MTLVPVGDVRDLRPGEATVVRVGDRKIALFAVDGEVVALDPVCPHAMGPLDLGDVEGGVLTCPLHGWQFELRSGACLTTPGERAGRHAVRVTGTTVYVSPEPES